MSLTPADLKMCLSKWHLSSEYVARISEYATYGGVRPLEVRTSELELIWKCPSDLSLCALRWHLPLHQCLASSAFHSPLMSMDRSISCTHFPGCITLLWWQLSFGFVHEELLLTRTCSFVLLMRLIMNGLMLHKVTAGNGIGASLSCK